MFLSKALKKFEGSIGEEERSIKVKAGYMFPPASEHQAYLYMRDVWEKINPPVIEKDRCGKWFYVIYGVKVLRKPRLFIGKLTRRVLWDAECPTSEIELDCLKPPVKTNETELEEVPDHLEYDIGVFSAYNIIAGPLNARFNGNKKVIFEEYPNVTRTSNVVLQLNWERDKRNILRQVYVHRNN